MRMSLRKRKGLMARIPPEIMANLPQSLKTDMEIVEGVTDVVKIHKLCVRCFKPRPPGRRRCVRCSMQLGAR